MINEKMFMDGKEVQGVALCGSKMVWKNLHHQSLPSSGEIEFSEDGESIVSSTLGFSSAGTGTRVKPAKPEPQATVSTVPSDVSYY